METINLTKKPKNKIYEMKRIFMETYDQTKAADLATFVSHPYARSGDIDPVSKIYQTFQATKSSPAVAIFYFFAIMSHWNLLKGTTYKLPKDYRTHHPNLWVMTLAHSGASKSQQLALLDGLLPDEELRSSFRQPASPASLIAQFADKPIHLWVEDEAAKYLKQIETPTHPLAPIKGHLLKIKGGDSLTYHSKKDGETVIENPRMSIYLVNTIIGMMNTISEESMYDGFLSRIGLVLSETPEQMQLDIEERYPERVHDLSEIEASGLREDLEALFEQDIEGKEYTFNKGAHATFEDAARRMDRTFAWMAKGEENIYKPFYDRTLMEAFKYAIFYRQMMKKEGTVIDAFDVEYGMLVARYHLCSFARYLQLRDSRREHKVVEVAKRVEAKEEGLNKRVKAYVEANPQSKLREIYRKLNITKAKALEVLEEIGYGKAFK
jgi:hypothetical protein